jgi:hypothetical protein
MSENGEHTVCAGGIVPVWTDQQDDTSTNT